MTKSKQPLADEMCEILSRHPWLGPDVDGEGAISYVRAAANFQVEVDAQWWSIILKKMKILHPDTVDMLVEEFKRVMRTQEES